jgi:hypothetical protein
LLTQRKVTKRKGPAKAAQRHACPSDQPHKPIGPHAVALRRALRGYPRACKLVSKQLTQHTFTLMFHPMMHEYIVNDDQANDEFIRSLVYQMGELFQLLEVMQDVEVRRDKTAA